MVMLANGKTTITIAKILNLSERTIAHHRSDILSKYQAANITEMIRAAQNAGELKLKGQYYLERRRSTPHPPPPFAAPPLPASPQENPAIPMN
jgi:hypothetical protein